MEIRCCRPGSLDFTVAEKMGHDVYRATKYVRSGDIVLDVGANIGAFCVFVKSFCPESRVICVEPMPSNIDTLRTNVSSLAEIDCVALSSKSGPMTIYDFGLSCSGCHSMYDLGVSTATPVQVEGVTLGELLNRHGLDRVRFLKIDCQGAEYDAIPSAGSSVLSRIDIIALEIHGVIAAGPHILGTIPNYPEKAQVLHDVLSQTHRLVHGSWGSFDSEVVWERR